MIAEKLRKTFRDIFSQWRVRPSHIGRSRESDSLQNFCYSFAFSHL